MAGTWVIMSKKRKEQYMKNIEPHLLDIRKDFDKLSDPEFIKRGQELHKEISCISAKDLLEPFTI